MNEKTEKLREKIAQNVWFELAKQEARDLHGRVPESPKEFYDQVLIDKTQHYNFADQILKTCKEAGLVFAEVAKGDLEGACICRIEEIEL